MTSHPNAFIIMPFDPEFTTIYDQLIKPALEGAGYNVRRADSFFDQQNILRDIVRGIAEASLVVAELTTPNPNVLYELGLCHGLKIPTIQIAQSMDEVPFDLRSYRTIVYSTKFDKVGELINTLTEIGLKHLNSEIMFGSPVIDFLPEKYQDDLRQGGKQDEDSIISDAQEEFQDEGGYLDFILEGSNSAEEMTALMDEFAEETKDIGDKMKSHTAKIIEISNNPGPGSAAQAHKIASLVAHDLSEYSEKMEQLIPEYEKCIEAFEDNYSGYINWLSPNSDESREQITGFRNSIEGLLNGSRSGLEGTRSFRDAIIGLRGISRDVNRASRRVTTTLEKMITLLEKVEAFCAKSLIILDEKLANPS